MADIMMKCGCRANATYKNKSACAVHMMFDGDAATTPAEVQPNLEGRKAKCAYGEHAIVDSSLSLAFFEYHGPGSPQGERPMDVHYCGCRGFD